jgi:hypothetical protein
MAEMRNGFCRKKAQKTHKKARERSMKVYRSVFLIFAPFEPFRGQIPSSPPQAKPMIGLVIGLLLGSFVGGLALRAAVFLYNAIARSVLFG